MHHNPEPSQVQASMHMHLEPQQPPHCTTLGRSLIHAQAQK